MAIYGSDPRAYFEFKNYTSIKSALDNLDSDEIGRLIQIRNDSNVLENDNYRVFRIAWFDGSSTGSDKAPAKDIYYLDENDNIQNDEPSLSCKCLVEIHFPRPLTALRYAGMPFENDPESSSKFVYYLKDGELGYFDENGDEGWSGKPYPFNNYTPLQGDIVLAHYIDEKNAPIVNSQAEFVFYGTYDETSGTGGQWELLGDENIYVTKNSNANLNSLSIEGKNLSSNQYALKVTNNTLLNKTQFFNGEDTITIGKNSKNYIELNINGENSKFNTQGEATVNKIITVGTSNPNKIIINPNFQINTSNQARIILTGVYVSSDINPDKDSNSSTLEISNGSIEFNRSIGYVWNKQSASVLKFGVGSTVASSNAILTLDSTKLQFKAGATFNEYGASRLQTDQVGSNSLPVYFFQGKPQKITKLHFDNGDFPVDRSIDIQYSEILINDDEDGQATFNCHGASRLQNDVSGATNKDLIWFQDGIPTKSNATVGDSTTPIYLNDGKFTAVDNFGITVTPLVLSGNKVADITINGETTRIYADKTLSTTEDLIDYTNFDGSTYLVWEGGDAQDSDRIETIFDAQNENDF